jgi:hypothetical protein
MARLVGELTNHVLRTHGLARKQLQESLMVVRNVAVESVHARRPIKRAAFITRIFFPVYPTNRAPKVDQSNR